MISELELRFRENEISCEKEMYKTFLFLEEIGGVAAYKANVFVTNT